MSTTSITPSEGQLSAQQEAFAVNYASNGGNGREAAIEAGYSEATAAQQASRLRRNPLVAKRIADECMIAMASNVPAALAVQRQLLTSSRSDMVKHLIATDMLDRTLGKAVQRVDAHTSAELTVRIDLT